MNILLLGANGFIGSNLSAYILKNTDWTIHAMDLHTDKLAECVGGWSVPGQIPAVTR